MWRNDGSMWRGWYYRLSPLFPFSLYWPAARPRAGQCRMLSVCSITLVAQSKGQCRGHKSQDHDGCGRCIRETKRSCIIYGLQQDLERLKEYINSCAGQLNIISLLSHHLCGKPMPQECVLMNPKSLLHHHLALHSTRERHYAWSGIPYRLGAASLLE